MTVYLYSSVFSTKWVPQNCLLAYISMKFRENLSTPLFYKNLSFQLSTPFLQSTLGYSNPPLGRGEGSKLWTDRIHKSTHLISASLSHILVKIYSIHNLFPLTPKPMSLPIVCTSSIMLLRFSPCLPPGTWGAGPDGGGGISSSEPVNVTSMSCNAWRLGPKMIGDLVPDFKYYGFVFVIKKWRTSFSWVLKW